MIDLYYLFDYDRPALFSYYYLSDKWFAYITTSKTLILHFCLACTTCLLGHSLHRVKASIKEPIP